MIDFEINDKEPNREISRISHELQEKQSRLSQTEKPFNASAIWLDRWVQQNFKTEGEKVGGWVPFARGGRVKSDGTIDTSAKLLQDTGRLRSSFIPWHQKDNAGIKSDLPYAKNHHYGLFTPRRRLLPVAAEVAKDIRKIFEYFVKVSISDKR